MKRLLIVFLSLLLVIGVTSLIACDNGDSGITDEEKTLLDTYISEVSDYLNAYTRSGMSAPVKIAAMQLQSDLASFLCDGSATYEKNKESVDMLFEEGLADITKALAPEFKADAKGIEEFLFPTESVYAGKLVFNDLLGGMLGEMSAVLGGGRANYTAGAVAYEERIAVFTYEEMQNICTLSDAALREKMFAVDNVSGIIRSCVVTFNNDGRFVMTTHYTELGVEYLNATGRNVELYQEYYVFGTYNVSLEADAETNDYNLNVVLQDETELGFVLNTSTEEVYAKDMIFTRVPLVKFDESKAQVGGYPVEDFAEGTEKFLNIAYGDKTMVPLGEGDENYNPETPESETVLNDRQKMDIFLPANFDKNREGGNGVIMMIHGGSWTAGEKESVVAGCSYYANRGYVTAAMNHTYAGRKYNDGTNTVVGFAEIEAEIDMAFRKIKEMSDENGWNITKGATYGYSSGSHLAAWYAYGKGNEADAPIPIVCTFSMVGPMSFYLDCWVDGLLMPLGPQVAVIGLKDPNLFTPDEDKIEELTKQIQDLAEGKIDRSELDPMDYTPYDEATYRAKLDYISPLSYVKNGDAVPTVLGEAMLDTMLISGEHGLQMAEAFAKLDIENDIIMLANSDHLCAGNAECGNVFRMRAEEYIKKYFGY